MAWFAKRSVDDSEAEEADANADADADAEDSDERDVSDDGDAEDAADNEENSSLIFQRLKRDASDHHHFEGGNFFVKKNFF
jgi:hypothetical protein